MREIKFRVWDKDNKKMWHKIDLNFSIKYGQIYIDNDYIKELGISKNVELLQYTGLKDKNGKGIYEGDIVKIDINKFIAPKYMYNQEPFYAEISFENYHWSCSGGKGKSLYNYTTISYAELEVIGNKYENPELLGDVNECSR